MSRGLGAHANKIIEDEKAVVYEYGGFNYNEAQYYNENHILDGTITIPKNCFIESDIHEKIKRMPSGRKKLIVKRIPVSVNYSKMIEEGRITVENCSNCWKTTDDDKQIDVMVSHILFQLFLRYQEEGKVPDSINILF